MRDFQRMFRCIIVMAILLVLVPAGSESGKKVSSIGLYIFENIEGYHTVSSTAGTELTNVLLKHFKKVSVVDRVPLESNETVRILEEMTKERKVTITSIHTWLSGGVISSPTLTFADDAIKFKDLTWHIDSDKVVRDASEKGLKKILYGSFTGYIGETNNVNARLGSVTVVANLRLMTTDGESVEWAKTYRAVTAGFDPRVAFDEAVVNICKTVSEDLESQF